MRARPAAIAVAAFLAGAVLLSVEIAASRVLSPFFGNSLFVWGALIGVVLAGLAVGYWVGGTLADSFPRPELLVAAMDAGELAIVCDGRAHLIRDGQLAASADFRGDGDDLARLRVAARWTPVHAYWPPAPYREAAAVSSWLRRNVGDVRLLFAERAWCLPAGARPSTAFSVRRLV